MNIRQMFIMYDKNIFFFYWHYNPLWVLAFSVILFHSALSLQWFLHRLIPIICISSSMSAIHLFLGLPLIRVPRGFHSNILLGVRQIFTFKSVTVLLSMRWRHTGPAEVQLHSFLPLVLKEYEWLTSGPVCFNPPLTRERISVPFQQEALCAPEAICTFWKRYKSLAPAVIRTPAHPAHGLVCV